MTENFVMFGFNTQPPEGGWVFAPDIVDWFMKFQHTAARRRLAVIRIDGVSFAMFQHTAARRRLAEVVAKAAGARVVSTHSRPKAAGYSCQYIWLG